MLDPSDVDIAMQLSRVATRLAKLALAAVIHDKQGLRMGRDESIFIAAAARKVLDITGTEYKNCTCPSILDGYDTLCPVHGNKEA